MSTESFNDFELRQLMISHGYPNIPITETTRGVITKQLKNLISTQKNLKLNQKLNQRNASRQGPERKSINSKYRPSLSVRDSPNESFTSKYLTSNIYVPPVINKIDSFDNLDSLDFGSDQDLTMLNSSKNLTFQPHNSLGCNSNKSSDVGVVSRLLSFRGKTLSVNENLSLHNLHKADGTPPYQFAFGRISTEIQKSGRAPNAHPYANRNWLSISRFKKQICIPYALIALFLIFLVVIAFMYIVISPDVRNSLNESNINYILCDETPNYVDGKHNFELKETDFKIRDNCIKKRHLNYTLVLWKELIGLLQKRVKQKYCNHEQLQNISISTHEFVEHCRRNNAVFGDVKNIMYHLQDMKYLIDNNPQWNVITSTKSNLKIDAEYVQHRDINSEMEFVLAKENVPLMCFLYSKIEKFFIIIGTIAILMSLAFISYICFKYIKSWRNERNIAVDYFIKKIIDALLHNTSSNANGTKDNVVIINHLRDKLLPIKKRNALLKSWNQALQILEMNDSRIQFGVCMRNGEEFRTMQWIGDAPNKSDGSQNKQWHSSAFNNVNKILDPPTTCLKIRQMFDPSEINNPNLKQIITEALLNKIGTACDICDIQIDKENCCVYLRCASEADAGIVHNEINGWWFDKRLISIKFVRLQRYLYRFPTSTN